MKIQIKLMISALKVSGDDKFAFGELQNSYLTSLYI